MAGKFPEWNPHRTFLQSNDTIAKMIPQLNFFIALVARIIVVQPSPRVATCWPINYLVKLLVCWPNDITHITRFATPITKHRLGESRVERQKIPVGKWPDKLAISRVLIYVEHHLSIRAKVLSNCQKSLVENKGRCSEDLIYTQSMSWM